MGALDELTESESESDHEQNQTKKAKASKEVTLDDLQQHGYSGGPSVLFVPPPEREEGNWAW